MQWDARQLASSVKENVNCKVMTIKNTLAILWATN
jgi:hypothetical protein